MTRLNILVACEESQVVCEAFRALGHTAWSCDIIPPSGGHPEWHFLGDVTPYLRHKWDMIIAFPPCTHLTKATANLWKVKAADGRQGEAIRFFMQFTDTDCPKVAIENPVGKMSTYWRKPDQIIQPWMFGHTATKTTCLWLKGLPKLTPTNIVDHGYNELNWLPPSKDRAKLRSKTYAGIAEAMAQQWGGS